LRKSYSCLQISLLQIPFGLVAAGHRRREDQMPNSSYDVIRDVGETLRSVLEDAIRDTLEVSVKLEAPKKIEETGDQNTLYVFLYRIEENADLKNLPPLTSNGNVVRRQPFDLHFMLTPNSKEEKDALRLLGRAMQALLEKSILLGADLQGSRDGTAEQLRISMNPLTQETITQIWQALEAPMRIAAFYLVTPVFIESEPQPEAERVREREARAF